MGLCIYYSLYHFKPTTFGRIEVGGEKRSEMLRLQLRNEKRKRIGLHDTIQM